MTTTRDPGLWCEMLDWYLTVRDADIGLRSNFGALVAALEGKQNRTGSSGDRFHAGQVELNTSNTAIAKDRVMRRRWSVLSPRTRETLASYYTGCCKVEDPNGFRKFPVGAEVYLGRFAGVAFYLCKESESVHLLLLGLSKKKGTKLEPFLTECEKAVRAAHEAYYEVAGLEDVIEKSDVLEEFEELTANRVLPGRDGVWRQAS